MGYLAYGLLIGFLSLVFHGPALFLIWLFSYFNLWILGYIVDFFLGLSLLITVVYLSLMYSTVKESLDSQSS